MTYNEYKDEVIEHVSNRISLELDANDSFIRDCFKKGRLSDAVAGYFLFELSKTIIKETVK